MEKDSDVVPGISAASGGGQLDRAAISIAALPAPRLQLRWEINAGKQRFAADDARFAKLLGQEPRAPTPEWLCHYELVLPLGEHDVRRETYGPRGGRRADRTELVVPLKRPAVRGGAGVPCTVTDTGERYADPPFRDGAHAQWDARLLGDPPVYVIAPDGSAFRYPDLSDGDPTQPSTTDASQVPGTDQNTTTPRSGQ